MVEAEPRRFRRGESPGRPYGGNVAEGGLARELYELALSCGIESQSHLSRVLGTHRTQVGLIYSGKRLPSRTVLDSAISFLNPDGEHRNRLKELFAQERAEKRARRERPETNNKTPFVQKLDDFCSKLGMTRKEFNSLFGYSGHACHGLGYMFNVLGRLQEVIPSVEKEDLDGLAEAFALTYEAGIQSGRRFQEFTGVQVKKRQESLVCKTYNGQQAGEILGVSREVVRRLRNRYGLPLLLTNEDLNTMRKKAGARSKIKVSGSSV